jgi:hypothetical protein
LRPLFNGIVYALGMAHAAPHAAPMRHAARGTLGLPAARGTRHAARDPGLCVVNVTRNLPYRQIACDTRGQNGVVKWTTTARLAAHPILSDLYNFLFGRGTEEL